MIRVLAACVVAAGATAAVVKLRIAASVVPTALVATTWKK